VNDSIIADLKSCLRDIIECDEASGLGGLRDEAWPSTDDTSQSTELKAALKRAKELVNTPTPPEQPPPQRLPS
jgi:hypothetical protein